MKLGLDLQIIFFVACVATTYWFWIRPLLKTVPAFAHFYAVTGSFWAAYIVLTARIGRVISIPVDRE